MNQQKNEPICRPFPQGALVESVVASTFGDWHYTRTGISAGTNKLILDFWNKKSEEFGTVKLPNYSKWQCTVVGGVNKTLCPYP